MELMERRRYAAERSQGTSSEAIRSFVLGLLKQSGAQGSLLDFGAGRGELLMRLQAEATFSELAGMDLLERPAGLGARVAWHRQDLNLAGTFQRRFDVVVCSEVIEHLENPRHVFRTLSGLVRSGGKLVLTMPNQESLRSLLGLVFRGHFTHFLGDCYPAHITALLRLDLVRLCAEVGLSPPQFYYTDDGVIPRLTSVRWQAVSFGLLRGRWFSDNLAIVATR
jgi:2-polyprenyl-3-methyl-5-hydroxy-6-metoxy-1,4-benzoquinol methylase